MNEFMEFYGIEPSKRVCEVCGEPAMHLIQDLEPDGYEADDTEKKWMKKKLHSVHLFCVNHKRGAILHGVSLEK